MTLRALLIVVAAFSWSPPVVFAQVVREPPKVDRATLNVRKRTEGIYAKLYYGVVEEVDEQKICIACSDDNNAPSKKYEAAYVDLLVQGKLLKDATAEMAYHWKDVKKGDTVTLCTAFDDGENKLFCLAICIQRRPGAKLPESSDPKHDGSYVIRSLKNDIENGVDVDDADIVKVYPPKLNPFTRRVESTGGLPKEWQTKLDAIREKAKKDKDLKATPPEKK